MAATQLGHAGLMYEARRTMNGPEFFVVEAKPKRGIRYLGSDTEPFALRRKVTSPRVCKKLRRLWKRSKKVYAR